MPNPTRNRDDRRHVTPAMSSDPIEYSRKDRTECARDYQGRETFFFARPIVALSAVPTPNGWPGEKAEMRPSAPGSGGA